MSSEKIILRGFQNDWTQVWEMRETERTNGLTTKTLFRTSTERELSTTLTMKSENSLFTLNEK